MIALDNNELGFLKALYQSDPDREGWTAHWASTLSLRHHGVDLVAQTYEGSYALMKRLAERKLVDREPGRMSHDLGVCMNDKGEEALAENGIDLVALRKEGEL